MRDEPATPAGKVAKEAARFGFDANDAYNPTMDYDDQWGENGFSEEIQSEAPALMWDTIAEAVIAYYKSQETDR